MCKGRIGRTSFTSPTTNRVHLKSERRDTIPWSTTRSTTNKNCNFAKPPYKVQRGFGVNKSALYCSTYFVDKGAGQNLTGEAYLSTHLQSCIKRLYWPEHWSATKESTDVQGFIPLNVKIGTLQVRTLFVLVENFAVDILCCTMNID